MIFFPEPAYDAAGNCIGQMMTPVPRGAYVVESESGHRALMRPDGSAKLVTAGGLVSSIWRVSCFDIIEPEPHRLWALADELDTMPAPTWRGLNR